MFREYMVSLGQVALVFAVCALACVHDPAVAPLPASADPAASLVVQWLVLPGLMLLAAVVPTSLTRFFGDSDAFGGARLLLAP
jgi:hypothetical protein